MGRKYLSSAVDPVNRIALSTGFRVNAAKSASARLADLCRGESKNLNRWRVLSRPHRLKKISSMQSQRRDPHLHWPHRETRDYNSLLEVLFTTITNHNLPFDMNCFLFRFFFFGGVTAVLPRWVYLTFTMKIASKTGKMHDCHLKLR